MRINYFVILSFQERYCLLTGYFWWIHTLPREFWSLLRSHSPWIRDVCSHENDYTTYYLETDSYNRQYLPNGSLSSILKKFSNWFPGLPDVLARLFFWFKRVLKEDRPIWIHSYLQLYKELIFYAVSRTGFSIPSTASFVIRTGWTSSLTWQMFLLDRTNNHEPSLSFDSFLFAISWRVSSSNSTRHKKARLGILPRHCVGIRTRSSTVNCSRAAKTGRRPIILGYLNFYLSVMISCM